jgi:threonyl-tRNA synthetase
MEDYPALEKIAQLAIQEKQPFQRLDLDKDTLLEMFKYSKYKVHFIKDKIPDGGSTTVYRCGPLIDLCTGPHIPHTGRIKAFAVMKVTRLTSLSYGRIQQHTGLVMLRMIHYKESTESVFLTRNK